MNGHIFDIKRFAVHDGPGIRTTIFFHGCPLSCWWCHNPECNAINHTKTKQYSVIQLIEEVKKDQLFFEESGGGITFSGGEPMQQKDFLFEVAHKLKQQGFHLTLDTSGYFHPSSCESICQLFDLVLFDIKHMDAALHKKNTGIPNHTLLTNLNTLHQMGCHIRLRYPYIPSINADANNISLLKELALKLSLPVDILPYHKTAKHKYLSLHLPYRMEGIQQPDPQTLNSVLHDFQQSGITSKLGG